MCCELKDIVIGKVSLGRILFNKMGWCVKMYCIEKKYRSNEMIMVNYMKMIMRLWIISGNILIDQMYDYWLIDNNVL